jgi:hypothetical protein
MKALLLIGAILGALALAGTAAADSVNSANRATVTNYSWCSPTPLGTVCSDVKTVTKLVVSASGNVSYVSNGTTEFRMSFPFAGCDHSVADSFHVHWLDRDDEVQSQSERLIETTSFRCGAWGQTCVSTYELHLANGETQVQRGDFVCSEL